MGERGRRGEMRCRLSGEKERSRKLRKDEWSREGRKGGGEGRRGEHHQSQRKKGEVTVVGEELMKRESEDGT